MDALFFLLKVILNKNLVGNYLVIEPNFINSEMTDMHLTYAIANGDARHVRRVYVEK